MICGQSKIGGQLTFPLLHESNWNINSQGKQDKIKDQHAGEDLAAR